MTEAPIVFVKNLKKKYKDGTMAVKGISFKIKKGEIFGFLGPNGAGKTTTIKILTTLLKPTEGKAIISGVDVEEQSHKVRQKIGVVFQTPALDSKLTAWENLDFHARLYGIPSTRRDKRIKQVLKLVGLNKISKKLVEKFSGGMKRRLELARGLMHNPEILFLDEPTLGLDVQTRNKIWEYIMKIKKDENMTIFLTTHYMEEAEKVCERIAIIDEGKILKMGTPQELIDASCHGIITVKTKNKIKKSSNILNVKKMNGKTLIKVKDNKKITKVISEIMKKYEVEEISISKPSLEDVFLNLTGKSIRDDKPQKRKLRIGRFR